ncbi:hypothetical protein EXN66_Car005509 [Channa argus]|uniref:Uncharacterized protein n=1 Tax=Channa argus TaxID=215402 RepID=A0A6G1PHX4_CHAAH|nr:hypothetical protein EXN66_Car005509 [Channa argus]
MTKSGRRVILIWEYPYVGFREYYYHCRQDTVQKTEVFLTPVIDIIHSSKKFFFFILTQIYKSS